MKFAREAKEVIHTLESDRFYVECPCCNQPILLKDAGLFYLDDFSPEAEELYKEKNAPFVRVDMLGKNNVTPYWYRIYDLILRLNPERKVRDALKRYRPEAIQDGVLKLRAAENRDSTPLAERH